jgi:predicted glycogen debranching enzyme
MDGATVLSPEPGLPVQRLERPALVDLDTAVGYEWLVANGLGGYASGTVTGLDTRRYHGLLIAALPHPLGRTLLLSRIHEGIDAGSDAYALPTAQYHDGTIQPAGYVFLEQFRLEGTMPVWRYRCRDLVLEKSLWMERGRNTTFVRYHLPSAQRPVRLRLEPFTLHRSHHTQLHGDPEWRMAVESVGDSCRVEAFPGATPLWMRLAGGSFVETGLWYWRFLHRRERERGYDDLEDLYTPGIFGIDLAPGETATFIATTHREDLELDPVLSLAAEQEAQLELLRRAGGTHADTTRRRLVLAADQFLVQPEAGSSCVVAGYPWYGQRVRDCLVALPGLCLSTGRFAEGRQILVGIARRLRDGLLPNQLSRPDDAPEYGNADAALWLFECIARYRDASGDTSLVDELLPALWDAVSAYREGTPIGVGLDSSDGLLRIARGVVPLTWMDARIGDWLVTPCHGKPVELQALWYNALRLLVGWLRDAARPRESQELEALATRCRESFGRLFWDEPRGCCFDVVEGADADGVALRPNQLLAAALSHPILDEGHWEPMLSALERELITPYGPRSLSPRATPYVGSYGGNQVSRDLALHQGSVWPWLVGPYVRVARRVRGVEWDARPLLEGLASQLGEGCLGQMGELFDGDAPHYPGGTIAQACSVAALLEAWVR